MAILALAVLSILPIACRREASPEPFALRSAVAAEDYVVGQPEEGRLVFPLPPEIRAVTVGPERRAAVVTPPSGFTWRGRLPERSRLHVGAQVLPEVAERVGGIAVEAAVAVGEERRVVGRWRLRAGHWLDAEVDLGEWGGQEAILELSVRAGGRLAAVEPAVAWAPVTLVPAAARRRGERPNVLFILVDTLRADRLTPYGYRRATSPSIQRLLASAGTVVEEAYAPASWTLPSMVGLFTGRYPGALAGAEAFRLPPGVPTLAEEMALLGYETAGFYANPTLSAVGGFDRGFATYYSPPPELSSLSLHADSINRRALPWLSAHSHRPFFLYLHYLDPHDPYANPDMPNGRSPWLPDYSGDLTGESVHGVYAGVVELDDPEADVAHLSALYDGEVRHVDQAIGELLGAIPPEILRDTLIVFTSDHGEELYDHGGWKHGESLYQEQIRVPLVVRWDRGGVVAGQRLDGNARLVDLMPTILSAAGGDLSAAWDGVDLLPALTGLQSLPRWPAFAQHFGRGPLRAAAVLGRFKLILFNREAPFEPADALEEHLWRLDLERFERVELYDLVRDPAERNNLAAARPDLVAQLAPLVHRRVAPTLTGLRVMMPGERGSGRLTGRLRFEATPAGWHPYFLGEGDEVKLAGRTLTFSLGREIFSKGFMVLGEPGAVERVTVEIDGEAVTAGSILTGAGVPYRGGRLAPEALTTAEWPLGSPDSRPGVLYLWHPAPRAAETELDDETERRLKALGYL